MKSPEYIAEAKAYLSSMSEHDLDDAGDEFQRLFGYAMELSLALTASGEDVAGLLAGIRALLSVTDHGSNSGPVFDARVIAYRALNGRGAIAQEKANG